MNVELRDFEISDSETELLIEPATRSNRLNGRSFRNRRQESFKLGSFLKKLCCVRLPIPLDCLETGGAACFAFPYGIRG
uniref:Uncharacterized protein n=1 Tax=Anopheles dirus TaxID=7168 RepID=A0A182NFB4_9DIPT